MYNWFFMVEGQEVFFSEWEFVINFLDMGIYFGNFIFNFDMQCGDIVDI